MCVFSSVLLSLWTLWPVKNLNVFVHKILKTLTVVNLIIYYFELCSRIFAK